MAYGKIKADTLVYDNSGTDTDVTIASLGAKASLPASAGTVGASEVVQVDANKDITGFRNVTLSGDLTVNGTTTTINSTTLTVDDKNIELGTVDTPTDTTADGGGITLKGATDKTITWTNSTDTWDFNQGIYTTGKLGIGTPAAAATTFFIVRTSADHNFEIEETGGDLRLSALNNARDTNIALQFSALSYAFNNGNATFAGTISDSKGDVRSIPKQTNSGSHTLAATSAGKVLYTDNNTNVNNSVFSAGDAVTIINNSGSDQTITQGSGLTIYNTADASTGNRTLASRGMATLWFADASTAYISGAGLS